MVLDTRFFKDDPQIHWQKFMCPICGEPTGPQSKCETILEEDIPIYQRRINQHNLSLPIFSNNCYYKQSNLWLAEINYPVSQLLIQALSNLKGITKIVPIKPYCFIVDIGNLFNEQEVKHQVTRAYRAFIKEWEAKEIDILSYSIEDDDIIGIIFPNGKVFNINDESEISLVRSISENLPNTQLIKRKGN